MTDKYINVLDFSDDPWGRDESDNPETSGAAFREQYLVDAFKYNDTVTVDFSSLQDIPDSAWLGGAFVGLVKKDGFSYKEVFDKLQILPNDDFYPKMIFRILELAKEEEIRLGVFNG
ncbi:TPA: hypothetical protein ACPOY2_001823 [Haemophilus influenzae]|jgi:hypothetical protein